MKPLNPINPFRSGVILCLTIVLFSMSTTVFALKIERGREPARDNSEWPRGLIAVVNLKSRFASVWVNGNEIFFYKGTTEDFNEALEKFAKSEQPVKNVYFTAEPGTHQSFDGKLIEFQWKLNAPSGLYLARLRRKKTPHLIYPSMIVHVDESSIILEKVIIPAGITVINSYPKTETSRKKLRLYKKISAFCESRKIKALKEESASSPKVMDKQDKKIAPGFNVSGAANKEFEQAWIEAREAGSTLWGSEKWMKSREYYKGLNTRELAEKCFDRPIFAFEMGAYNSPVFALLRLKIMHNGFAELFEREDMMEGFLHAYEYLSTQLIPENYGTTIVIVAGNLSKLSVLFELPFFAERVKGKEKLFFKANYNTLKQFYTYLDTYEEYLAKHQPSKAGQSPLFFGEATTIVRVLSKLLKAFNPQKHYELESIIQNRKLSKDQNVDELKAYLGLAIENLTPLVDE